MPNKAISPAEMTEALIEEEYEEVKKWLLLTPYEDFRNQRFYERIDYKKVGEIKPDANGSALSQLLGDFWRCKLPTCLNGVRGEISATIPFNEIDSIVNHFEFMHFLQWREGFRIKKGFYVK